MYHPFNGVLSVLSVNYHPSDGVINVMSVMYHPFNGVLSVLSVNYQPSNEVLSVLGVDYYPFGRVISIKSQLCIPSGGLCWSGGDPICYCKLQSFAYLALCLPLITTSGLGELRGPRRIQFLKPGRRIREKLQTTGKKLRPLGMNFFFFLGGTLCMPSFDTDL